jgi:hypothetical protein
VVLPVRPGGEFIQITYLGSFEFKKTFGNTIFGQQAMATGGFSLSNERARDLEKAIKVRQELGGKPIILAKYLN